MSRLAIFLLILFNFRSFDSISQDGWYCKVAFRLFDSKGKKVTIDSFCRNWKYVKGIEMDSICRGTADVFYNDSASIFIIEIGAVYPSPAKLSFVNGREKMTLIFSVDNKNVNAFIDSLVFHEGTFWIDGPQKSNKKVVFDFYPRIALFYDRGKIDWEQSKLKAKEYLKDRSYF